MARVSNNKKVLLVSNNPQHASGVAGQCRAICKRLWQEGYEVLVIAYSGEKPLPPPTICKFEIEAGVEAPVKILSTNMDQQTGVFNDMKTLVAIIHNEKPDCLVLFDDPHRFLALLDHSSFIRSKMPLLFIHLWDTYLAPAKDGAQHFNAPIYENFDHISCISHQTEWFVDKVYDKVHLTARPPLTYVGHGSDSSIFKPLPAGDYEALSNQIFSGKSYDFVALQVNRNQNRKKFPDLIEAWKLFMESLPKEQASKCALMLKTDVIQHTGTNLDAVIRALAPSHNIHLLPQVCSEMDLNKLYNIADVVTNVSNAEGFGLTTNEGMLAGKCIIANVTGGLVDQIGFTRDGKPVEWTEANFKQLDTAKAGDWCYPIFGQRTIIGAPATPYLYDYNASIDDIAKGFHYWHGMDRQERQARGLKARQYCIDNGLVSTVFADRVTRDINSAIASFKPSPLFRIYNV